MPNDFYEDESQRVNEKVDRDAERDPEREQARPRVTLIPKAPRLCPVCADGACETKSMECGR